MTRLIDADAWKLELQLLHGTNEKTAWLINRINHAPTVDAVPVVRCKDCENHREPVNICDIWHCHTSCTGYCHRAIKRKKIS